MNATCLTTNDDIADELERIGFIPYSSDRYDFHGSGRVRKLLARIVCLNVVSIGGVDLDAQFLKQHYRGETFLANSVAKFVVHFSQRKTFDRWANSTNFVVPIQPDHPEADLEKAAKQAIKICKAKVFNFNTYFHPIDLS